MDPLRRGLLGAGLGAVVLATIGCRRESSPRREAATVLQYGPAARQRVELTVPDGSSGPRPVVVLIHGGFWSNAYELDLMRPLVAPLVDRGLAVANIDYRSLGDDGGGWPGTFDDAAAAVDALAGHGAVDAQRVVVVGHSAGGHLAVWLAGRATLPPGAPGADPAVRVIGAVAQAGLLDLATAAAGGLGGGAVTALLGGDPAEVADRYALASPIERVPIGVPVALVHGPADGIVPIDQSTRYEAAARAAGDDVRLVEVPGDHFALIDPGAQAWASTMAESQRLLDRS